MLKTFEEGNRERVEVGELGNWLGLGVHCVSSSAFTLLR